MLINNMTTDMDTCSGGFMRAYIVSGSWAATSDNISVLE